MGRSPFESGLNSEAVRGSPALVSLPSPSATATLGLSETRDLCVVRGERDRVRARQKGEVDGPIGGEVDNGREEGGEHPRHQQLQNDGSSDREPSKGCSGTEERKPSILLEFTKSLNNPLESEPADQATNNGCNEPVPSDNEGEDEDTGNSDYEGEGREDPESEGPDADVTPRSLRENRARVHVNST